MPLGALAAHEELVQWSEPEKAGRYVHQTDVSRLASGTYFFELRAERDEETLFREVQKITVVR